MRRRVGAAVFVHAMQVAARLVACRAALERVTAVEQAKLTVDHALAERDRSTLQFQHWREEVQRGMRA